MNVNDLESRMLDCYFSGKAKKLLYPKNNTPEPGGKTIAGSGACLAVEIWQPSY
jgi:hypothetical protein